MSSKWNDTFKNGDVVFVHFHDASGKEFYTRDFNHPHPVVKENGTKGIYFFDSFEGKNVFKPFDAFASSVTFSCVLC